MMKGPRERKWKENEPEWVRMNLGEMRIGGGVEGEEEEGLMNKRRMKND
jgi:hypothetical protein